MALTNALPCPHPRKMDLITHLNAARAARFPLSVRTDVSTSPIANLRIRTAIRSALTDLEVIPFKFDGSVRSFLHSIASAGISRVWNAADSHIGD